MTKWEYAYMNGFADAANVTVLGADGSHEVYSEKSMGRKDSDSARRGRMLAKMGAAGWELFHSEEENGLGVKTYWLKRPISS